MAPWSGASDEEPVRKEVSLRIAVSYRELQESSKTVGETHKVASIWPLPLASSLWGNVCVVN